MRTPELFPCLTRHVMRKRSPLGGVESALSTEPDGRLVVAEGADYTCGYGTHTLA